MNPGVDVHGNENKFGTNSYPEGLENVPGNKSIREEQDKEQNWVSQKGKEKKEDELDNIT